MTQTRPTILIIDNDDGLVAAMSARLESLGYACVTAGTGAQGIAAFASHDIDLVITDLNMPAGDGVTLSLKIRETSNVPIVIVTGFRDEFKRELRTIDNVTLLRKPFDSVELVDIVETELALAEPRATR